MLSAFLEGKLPSTIEIAYQNAIALDLETIAPKLKYAYEALAQMAR